MNPSRVLVGLALVGAAAYLATAGARASAAAVESSEGTDDYVWPNLGYVAADDAVGQEISNLADETDWLAMLTPRRSTISANALAFLAAIRQCEGTAGAADPYRVCYAYRYTIRTFADHPAITGEWTGERLSDVQCSGAGLGPGCVSTAAGAYQIIKSTWRGLRDSLGLPDFSPASQDRAAVELLRQCGALARIEAGDLAGAIAKARRTWASLPGANYAGQGMRSGAQVMAWYQQAGGYVA
jgi:lysozyme